MGLECPPRFTYIAGITVTTIDLVHNAGRSFGWERTTYKSIKYSIEEIPLVFLLEQV